MILLLALTAALCNWVNAAILSSALPANAVSFKQTVMITDKASITFTGIVKSIEVLGKRKLKAIPIDVDARFILIIQIESVQSSEAPFQKGVEQAFAVHSPAKIFDGAQEKEIIGKQYQFNIEWEKDKEPQFSQLTVTTVEEKLKDDTEISCLKKTTIKVAGKEVDFTLKDAEQIKLAAEKYITKKKPKLEASVTKFGKPFIDCKGTIRMGGWLLESLYSNRRYV